MTQDNSHIKQAINDYGNNVIDIALKRVRKEITEEQRTNLWYAEAVRLHLFITKLVEHARREQQEIDYFSIVDELTNQRHLDGFEAVDIANKAIPQCSQERDK